MIVKESSFRGVPFKIACDDDGSGASTFVDEQDVRDRDWHITKDSCVLDIGAAYGSYALCALAVGAAYVYAWSPQREYADFMQESLIINGWEKKATVYKSGVYDRVGLLDMNRQVLVQDKTSDTIMEVGPLDDWYEKELQNLNYQTFHMKLDVESAELEVLRSGIKCIQGLRPTINIENHSPALEQQVRSFLASLGYKEISTHPYHTVSHSLFIPA